MPKVKTIKNFDPKKNDPVSYDYLNHFFYCTPDTGQVFAKIDIIMTKISYNRGQEVGKLKGKYIFVYLPNMKSMRRSDIIYILMTRQMIPEGFMVDHKKSDPTDDRWDELQLTTRSINNFKSKYVTSRRNLPRGISLASDKKRFRVRFSVDKIEHEFGPFDTLEEAIKVNNKERENIMKKYYPTLYTEFPTVTFSDNEKLSDTVANIENCTESVSKPKQIRKPYNTRAKKLEAQRQLEAQRLSEAYTLSTPKSTFRSFLSSIFSW